MRVRPRKGWLAVALFAALGCGGGGGSTDGGGGNPTSGETFFDVEGDIRIAFASAIDADTNDPAADSTPNDTPATAQPLPNPVTLGGYVNVPNTGATGRSQVSGDPLDYYRVSLAAGQTVRLFMAGDGINNDIDLALIDANGVDVDTSDTDTPAEDVVAPSAGEYLIEVSAFSGASSYVLSIGQATEGAIAPAAELVPGELLVRYRDGSTALRAADAADLDAARLGLARVGGGISGPQLLAARETEQLDVALRSVGKGHLSQSARVRRGAAAPRDRRERDAVMRRDTRRLAKALRRRADIASADPNYVRHASAVPTDEHYALQWHYPLIWLPEAWDLVAPASGVVVAVIDTGVVDEHPDLQGQLVSGYDFISSAVRARDGDGCDADPSDPGDRALNSDSSFHGTHVTGTIVARTSLAPGGDNEGVAGVAWNAKVMPLRVLGVGGGTDADLIQALRYAAGLSNTCGALPAAPADVINLSLGGAAQSATLDATIAQVRAAGVVVVAAAGNNASSVPTYPAASPGVISVSAVDAARNRAPYSNYGSTIDLAAPGGDLQRDRNSDGFADAVVSTLYDEDAGEFIYGGYQGTSMAAPHVSGVIALMLGVNPALTPGDIDNLLASGAMTRDIGSSTFFGRGLVDAFEAVGAAIVAEGGAVPGLPPRLVASPGAVNFGVSSTQVSVTLSNAGGPTPPIAITSFEAITDDGGSWLSIQPGSVNGAGLGSYTVRVSRAGVADGIYTGAARFHANTGDLDVPIIMQVGDAVTPGADAGRHYVLLVEPDTDPPVTAYAIAVEAANGRYRYRFIDIDPGRYFVYAGTDVDNDNIVCDRGEACGSYPTLEQPQVVEVDDNTSDLDFLTGFGLRIGASSTQAADSGISRIAPPAP